MDRNRKVHIRMSFSQPGNYVAIVAPYSCGFGPTVRRAWEDLMIRLGQNGLCYDHQTGVTLPLGGGQKDDRESAQRD